MKDNKDKFKELADITPEMDEEQQYRAVRKGSIAVILILLALVTVISFIMYFVEIHYGKTAGTVTLIVIAAVIALYLYRKELINKLRRK